jgi:hypothetical protein
MDDPWDKLAGWTVEDHLAFDIAFGSYAGGSSVCRGMPLGMALGGAGSPPKGDVRTHHPSFRAASPRHR